MASSESTAIGIILRHSKLVSEAIQQSTDMEGLAPGQAGLAAAVQEVRVERGSGLTRWAGLGML